MPVRTVLAPVAAEQPRVYQTNERQTFSTRSFDIVGFILADG